MNSNPTQFVLRLAQSFPPLKATLEQHLEENKGEVLPHLLMADYCRVVCKAPSEGRWIKQLLLEMEAVFSPIKDDATSNVIAVSFIEHLPPPSVHHAILSFLPPKMKHQYDAVFTLRP